MRAVRYWAGVFILVTMVHSASGQEIQEGNTLWDDIKEHASEAIRLRHELHQIPERQYTLPKTVKFVQQTLKKLGYDVTSLVDGSGLVAILDSGRPGKTVALRADMDGLPIEEKTAVSYKSTHPGKMHACGHDGHMAAALLAAKVLPKHLDSFSGKIKFIFQPAEEGGAGAKAMIDEGVLDDPKVDAIFGHHNWPLAEKQIASRPGCIMAGAIYFEITVQGQGGHAAMPHKTVNPIIVAASIIQSIQASANQQDPVEPLVVNFGSIHGGATANVVPEIVTLQGTMRTVSDSMYERMVSTMKSQVENISRGAGARGSFTVLSKHPYPPTVNDPKMVDLVLETAREILPEEQVTRLAEPVMPSEDFSFYLREIPGCFFFSGYGLERPGLHTETYDYNDAILAQSAYVLARSAVRFLGR